MGNSCGLPSRSHEPPRCAKGPRYSKHPICSKGPISSDVVSEKTFVDSLASLSVHEDLNYKMSSKTRCRGCGLHCPPHSCSVSVSMPAGAVKVPTDIVGIMKEGQISTVTATVQLLYHLRPFREMITDMRSKARDPRPQDLAAGAYLERVFRDLSESKAPIALGNTMPVLGWDDRTSQTRYNATYEMLSLFNTMIKHLGLGLKKELDELFSVELRDTHCFYRLGRDEECSNLTERPNGMVLDVEGHDDFDAAMRSLVQPSISYDGQGRKYHESTTTLRSIPDVWVIDLKRFDDHGFAGGMRVMRNRFEFEEQVDVGKYLSNDRPDEKSLGADVDTMYRLCGVLVFERIGWEGKWWLYLRLQNEDGGGKQKGDHGWTWWKFDGPMVCEVDRSEVVEGNFGPGLPDLQISWKEFEHQRGYWEYPRTADALIYVKQSKVDDFFGKRRAIAKRHN